MTTLYHQTKTSIGFWCKRELNFRSLIQLLDFTRSLSIIIIFFFLLSNFFFFPFKKNSKYEFDNYSSYT